MYYFILSLFLWFFESTSPAVEVINLEQLQAKTITKTNDSLYVVNFWATWCGPCMAELPYFEKAGKSFSAKKIKIVLVSLDFLRDTQKVDKFVANKKIKSQVYVLNAGNPNIWIDKIEPLWGGAIPATLFYRSGEKVFFREGDFTQAELDSLITIHLN